MCQKILIKPEIQLSQPDSIGNLSFIFRLY